MQLTLAAAALCCAGAAAQVSESLPCADDDTRIECLAFTQEDANPADEGLSFVQRRHLTARGQSAFLAPTAAASEDDPVEGYNSGPWGFDITGMDKASTPGDDFYSYANGGWTKETKIPSDQSSWTAFGILNEATVLQVKGILEKGEKREIMPSIYYQSFMNETKIEALGVEPVEEDLDKINNLYSVDDFAGYVGGTNFGFGSSPFSFYISADPKDPETNVAHLGQNGLGLPSRDYYIEEHFADTKEKYGEHIVTVLKMITWPDAEGAGADVLDFETSIAKVSWSREELRDPEKTYNKMTIGELMDNVEGFPWQEFMASAGGQVLQIPDETTVIVSAYSEDDEDKGVRGIAQLIADAEVDTLKAWAAFHLVRGASNYLSKDFVEAHFDFFGKVLSGQEEQKVRWKRAVNSANQMIGDAVGKEYVKEYFPESSKAKMDEMTSLLKAAFENRLKEVTWMGEETKAKALKKLESFTFEIGYPKKWREYEGVEMSPDELFNNAAKAIAWDWEFDLNSLDKPVDHAYWGMPPQVVNAFFDPTQNKCVFLAAILQPPFFDPKGDMSVNFGGIGAVIGHEMTHGFDDSGRKYNAKGELEDWWTPEDSAEFDKRAKAYGEQFANFTTGLPKGLHINPGLTMGENIADLGGLTISYDAYQMWLQKNAYTPTQPFLMGDGAQHTDSEEGTRRYFMGWSQVWRAKYTRGALEQRLTSDPHSPGMARATIPTQQLEPWYKAYWVTKGETLYLAPDNRVKIW